MEQASTHVVLTVALFLHVAASAPVNHMPARGLSPLIYAHPSERRSMATASKNLPKFSCSQAQLVIYETHVLPSSQLRGLVSSNLLLKAFGGLCQRRQPDQVLPDAFRRNSEHGVEDRNVVIFQRVSLHVHITTPPTEVERQLTISWAANSTAQRYKEYSVVVHFIVCPPFPWFSVTTENSAVRLEVVGSSDFGMKNTTPNKTPSSSREATTLNGSSFSKAHGASDLRESMKRTSGQ